MVRSWPYWPHCFLRPCNRMLYHCTTLQYNHNNFCAARLHTSTVGNVKIARSERSYYCYIHIPTFHIVWLLRNLSLCGKLCLRDDKNTAFA